MSEEVYIICTRHFEESQADAGYSEQELAEELSPFRIVISGEADCVDCRCEKDWEDQKKGPNRTSESDTDTSPQGF